MPGHYNQCKQIHRRLNDMTVYKGQYVLSTPLIHGLKYNGEQIIADYQKCMSNCEEESCLAACVAQTDFRFYDYYRQRGVCYPDACTAAELLILQSNTKARSVFSYDNEDRNGLTWTKKASSFRSGLKTEKKSVSKQRQNYN